MTLEELHPEGPGLDRRSLVRTPPDGTQPSDLWNRLQGVRTKRRRRRQGAMVSGALAAVAALVVAFQPGNPTPAFTGLTLVSGETPVSARLRDGSTIELAASGRLDKELESEREVRLAMKRGSAHFDVTRDDARLFVVKAGPVEVRVVGTSFSVARSDHEVVVEVSRGAVDVRWSSGHWSSGHGSSGHGSSRHMDQQLRRLRAGDRLIIPISVPRDAAPAPRTALPAQDGEEAEEPAASEAAASDPAPPVPSRAPRANADTLFTAATRARSAGQSSEAARQYAEFLRAYRLDPRAPLVALDLARIRLDAQQEPHAAVAPLRFALRHLRGSFREDARARLIEAYGRSGDLPACRTAKAEYERTYPDGQHAARVRRACD